MVTLYHRTTEDAARKIVSDGFRDGEDYYGTETRLSGVWLSDSPLDANEGACGNALLRVELKIGYDEIKQFECIEDGKPYQEWLIPASVINECGTTTIEEINDDRWKTPPSMLAFTSDEPHTK
jgi:hypothetical protein